MVCLFGSVLCVLHQSHARSALSSFHVSHKVARMAKKLGRPKLARSEYRGEFIIIRVRSAEKRAIIQAARNAGSPYTDWARSVLLSAARRASGR